MTDPKGLFVTASDTGVGKTQVAAALARALADLGRSVAVRKPVESGEGHDAELLREAAESTEPLEIVRRYYFRTPLSPERAAAEEGVRLTLEELVAAARADRFVLVEGAGGFLTPIAQGARNADLAVALGHPVLVVVPDRLGAINQALLVHEAAQRRGLEVCAIVLNGAEQAPVLSNAEDIRRWTGAATVVLPRVAAARPWRILADHWRRALLEGRIVLP